MEKNPEMQKAAINLRQIEKTDLHQVKSIATSPFRKLVVFPFPNNLSGLEQWLAGLDQRTQRYFLITASKGGSDVFTVGICGLHQIDWVSRHAEIIFAMIDKDKYGATIQNLPSTLDAMKQIINYGFNELGMNKLWIQIPEHNKSLEALEALGFVAEGVRREFFAYGQKPKSVMVLSLLLSEFGHL